MSPQITVFVPVYQGEHYLAETIKSILSQSFANFELLIIDDGSCDHSYEIAMQYATKDQRVRVLKNDGNRGVCYTRNRGLQEARGEFLALLDADDLSSSDRLEKQLAFLQDNPDVVGCGTQASIIDAEGKETGERIVVPTDKDELKVLLAFQNQFVNSSMMFRLAAIKQTKGYYGGLSEDYEFAAQLNSKHYLANLPETLVKYRSHAKGLSKQNLARMQEGERAVFSLIHRQLGIDTEPHLIDVHHRVLNEIYTADHLKTPVTLRDYEHLFILLRNANRRRKIYPLENFEHLLFTLFYEKLRKLRSRMALWIFMTSDLYQGKWVTAKMLRKLSKQVVGITND